MAHGITTARANSAVCLFAPHFTLYSGASSRNQFDRSKTLVFSLPSPFNFHGKSFAAVMGIKWARIWWATQRCNTVNTAKIRKSGSASPKENPWRSQIFKIYKCCRTHMHFYLHARTLQPVHCALKYVHLDERGNTLKQHQRASTRFCNASSNFADANWLLRAKTFCPLTAHPVHNHRRQFPRSPGHQYFLILRVMHPPKQFGKFGASL